MQPHSLRLAIIIALLVWAVPASAQEAGTLRAPDVVYVPTPQEVVEAMLQLADVTGRDVVYDLGSGDGRIPITAAQKFGATAVGIDISPERIKDANENLAKAGVGDKVKFVNQDLFETDLRPATVITLYLLPQLNLKLMPQLKQLKPGTRIVSHSFDMGSGVAAGQDAGGERPEHLLLGSEVSGCQANATLPVDHTRGRAGELAHGLPCQRRVKGVPAHGCCETR
jgi:SAM-dependent methyltransferase